MLIRKSIHTLVEIENLLKDIVLSNVEEWKNKIDVEINGETIHALSDRYKTFFLNGYTCVECGITGSFWALEKDYKAKRYHLNLYGLDKNNKEVLMTKDHIFPKSRGGKDIVSNYQTMCCFCNCKKGNNI